MKNTYNFKWPHILSLEDSSEGVKQKLKLRSQSLESKGFSIEVKLNICPTSYPKKKLRQHKKNEV